MRNFKNARTVRDCHCAKESSKECVAEVALAMGDIGLTGGAIYIYGEKLLDGFLINYALTVLNTGAVNK